MPSAEIITIGSELLLGETLDTNTQWIAQKLRGLGIDLFRTSTIGDNRTRISQIIRDAISRCDIVITTGGLGPTVDDPTREAIADATGNDLEYSPDLWESISSRIRLSGRQPGENQKKQAFLPKNSILIPNPVGTAPAFIVKTNKVSIISLPGVPLEMMTLFEKYVIPFLQENYHLQFIKILTLRCSGAGEGWIDEKIGELERLENPSVGLSAHEGIVDIRICAKAENENLADGLISPIEQEIRSRLRGLIFGVDKTTLEQVVLDLLSSHDINLKCFEVGTNDILDYSLNRYNHRNYNGKLKGFKPSFLDDASSGNLKSNQNTIIASLYIETSPESCIIKWYIQFRSTKIDKQLVFQGHPETAVALGKNLVLNQLRLFLQDLKDY